MVRTVRLPKITYLTLFVLQYLKATGFTNTADLAKAANSLSKNLVRMRSDKEDYKFLEDTLHGGLRGNFSTQLAILGYVETGSRKTAYYGFSSGDRLVNAVLNGKIILDEHQLAAYTDDARLALMLQDEADLLNIRESQAHIAGYLRDHPDFPLDRDTINFPKSGVLVSKNRQYFMRPLFNRYTEGKYEFSLLNYWKGNKLRKFNLHLLLCIPSISKTGYVPYDKFLTIKFEDVVNHPALFIYYDPETNRCTAQDGSEIKTYDLDDAIETFSDNFGNIEKRLAYNWDEVEEIICEGSAIKNIEVKPTEFFVFLEKYLDYNKSFKIDGKTVVDLVESASGGPDVILEYSGGTKQSLELEHEWSHYLEHKHHLNSAFKGAWLYADEKWDFDLIKKLFYQQFLADTFVPEVFLFTDETGAKCAVRVDWKKLECSKLSVS